MESKDAPTGPKALDDDDDDGNDEKKPQPDVMGEKAWVERWDKTCQHFGCLGAGVVCIRSYQHIPSKYNVNPMTALIPKLLVSIQQS